MGILAERNLNFRGRRSKNWYKQNHLRGAYEENAAAPILAQRCSGRFEDRDVLAGHDADDGNCLPGS